MWNLKQNKTKLNSQIKDRLVVFRSGWWGLGKMGGGGQKVQISSYKISPGKNTLKTVIPH